MHADQKSSVVRPNLVRIKRRILIELRTSLLDRLSKHSAGQMRLLPVKADADPRAESSASLKHGTCLITAQMLTELPRAFSADIANLHVAG